MKSLKFFLAAAAPLAVTAAHAQLLNAGQQVESFQQRNQLQDSAQSLLPTNIPSLYDGESSDVGPQSVLEIKPRRTWVEAFADEQFFYTDNMFLASQGNKSADVLVSTVQAALAPSPWELFGGQLAPRVGYQQQWYNFDLVGSGTTPVINNNSPFPFAAGLHTFDFNASTIFGDVTWRRQNWTFALGTDFRRLLNTDTSDEFYQEFVPRWFVRRDFLVSPKFAFAVGYEGDYRATMTEQPVPAGYNEYFNDRADNDAFIVASYRLCSHAILQPFYRLEYTHYTRIERDDLLNSFGLALNFPITQNVTLRTFINYDSMTTDGALAQNYRKFDAGGGLNFFIRF